MKAIAQRGDRLDANVTAINPGKSVEVMLETGEAAFLLWSGLAGGTDEGKLDRSLKLQLGSPLSVDVLDVHLGRDLGRKIQVREVGWTLPRPARKRRPRRSPNPHGGRTHNARGGIRVWRAD